MFIPYGNSRELQYSMEYFSGIQVESTTIYSMQSMDSILFHMDSTFFHIDSTHFHIETQAIIEYSSWGHQPNLVFCSVHWVRSHDFPKQVKIFKSMTFKIITHYVYIYYISKKSINCIESENKLQGLFYSLFWYKKSKNQVNFTKVTKNNE